jgi:hypothetical protein
VVMVMVPALAVSAVVIASAVAGPAAAIDRVAEATRLAADLLLAAGLQPAVESAADLQHLRMG